MNLKFRTNGGNVLKVFYNDLFLDKENKTHGTVHIGKSENGRYKGYVRTVQIAKNERRFFTWNKETFYMDDFLADTPDELVERIETENSNVTEADLCATLQKYGMNSLRLMIKTKPLNIVSLPFGGYMAFETYSNHEREEDYQWIEYKFNEDYLRMPSDCYKLKLVPADEKNFTIYPKEDFYVGDLVSLIKTRKDLYKLCAA